MTEKIEFIIIIKIIKHCLFKTRVILEVIVIITERTVLVLNKAAIRSHWKKGPEMKNMVKYNSTCLLIIALFTLLSTLAAPSNAGAETAHAPCYIKIPAGTELVFAIDSERKAELIVKKAADESEFTLTEYRNGSKRKGNQEETTKLDRDEYRKEWKFNKYFDQTPKSEVVDEIRISVSKGAVYAELSQRGDHRIDFYNTGYQRGTNVNPNISISIHITGDNESGGKTSGNLVLESETTDGQRKVPFTMEKGKTLKWDYPAEKKVNSVEVDITEGQAKVSLFQPMDYKAPAPAKKKGKPVKK